MKKLILFFFLSFAFNFVFAHSVEKKVSFSFKDTSKIKLLSLDFVNGTINVKGCKTNSVNISGKIKVRGDDQSVCEEVLKKVKIKTDLSGGELNISLNYKELRDYLGDSGFFSWFCAKRTKKVNLSVELELTVPEGFNMEFSGVNVDISVSNLNRVDISTVNGDVNVEDAEKVECESVNGDIKLNRVVYSVKCSVVNGDFSFKTRSKKISSISFDSVNGDAKISVPASVIGDVETSSVSSKTTLILNGEKRKERDLKYKGEGKCDIDISTVNGDIVIEGF